MTNPELILEADAGKSKKRAEAEKIIYDVMDILDPTGANTQFWKDMFKNMSDDQFITFCKRKLPFRFQTQIFKIEPKVGQMSKALDYLHVPMMEKLNMPGTYTNKDGVPVQSKEALVLYIHLKRMKQIITKKNSLSTDISKMNMKTGRLLDQDKNALTSGRELDALILLGLDDTTKEFSGPRADMVEANQAMESAIAVKGFVSDSEIPRDPTDALSKQILNTYLLGAGIYSNLLNKEYMLPITYQQKGNRKVERETE